MSDSPSTEVPQPGTLQQDAATVQQDELLRRARQDDARRSEPSPQLRVQRQLQRLYGI